MNYLFVIFCVLASHCTSQPIDESVVSVYTTPNTSGSPAPLDVYHQIANNIAERITSPIYRLFGINGTTAAPKKPTNLDHIELDEDKGIEKKPEMKPLNNEITSERDVEELTEDATKKTDKKPEKITLFSTYLPVLKNGPTKASLVANNESTTEFDDFDPFDDFPEEKPREGGFIYFLELLGSIIQLVWGGISGLFRPSSG